MPPRYEHPEPISRTTILVGFLAFPLLVALLFLIVTTGPAQAEASTLRDETYLPLIGGPPGPQPMIGVDLPDLEREISWGLNRERLKADLWPLALNRDLVNVAIERSQDMIDRGYFNHITPDGQSIWDITDEKGISSPEDYVGEIIARTEISDAAQIVRAWMESPAHKHVLTCGPCTHVGVGLATDPDGKNYITMVFMGEGNG